MKAKLFPAVLALGYAGLLFLLPATVEAAVAVDAVNSTTVANASTGTVTLTVGSGANRLLIVGVSDNNKRTISSVTVNTTLTMTSIGSQTDGATTKIQMFSLINPPAGLNTVQVTWSGGGVNGVIGAISFTGVNQTTPLGTFASATGTSTAPSVNVTSAAGEIVVDTVVGAGGTLTVDPSQTQRWNLTSTVRGGGSTEAGAATVTMSWTLSASNSWSIGGVSVKPPPTTSIGDGTNPANVTIAPDIATMLDAFTLQTSSGTDPVTSVTVALTAGTGQRLRLVEITDVNGVTVYGSVATSPIPDTVTIPVTGLTANTTLTTFKVRITPLSQAAMPAPPGATYTVTGTVTSFISTNAQLGSDTASATVTIDNQSPADVTGASATPGDAQVTLNWTNPGADFSNVVILRNTATISDVPAEGSSPAVGTLVGTSTVRYILSGTPFTDTGLTNGTTYFYKIFAKDPNGNYSTPGVQVSATPCGVVPDATYVSVNAQDVDGVSGKAIVSWSSANPVLLLRKTSAFAAGDSPVGGTTYVAGNTIGGATVVYDGAAAVAGATCTGTSCTQTGLSDGTTYSYKVFAKSATCYAPGVGTEVNAKPVAASTGTAWSYMLAGGSMLKGGTAGTGTLYVTSNASRIISLNTANGTESWAPAATTSPIQGWLTWLPVSASLARDAVSTASAGNASTLSWSHTVSGTNRLLIVSVAMGPTAAITVSGITYGGAALTLIGVADNTCCSPGRPRVEMWRLVAPATGANTVVVTLSGANGSVIGTAVSYTGVDQTTPLGTFANTSGSTATPSVTVTSAAGELVQDALGWETALNTATVAAGQTQQWNVTTAPNDKARSGGSTEAGAASVVMSWTLSGASRWSQGGVSIKPAQAVVIGGDQGGKVYSVNTTSGPTIWQVALTGADAFQAAVAAQLRSFSNTAFQAAYTDDVIFAATLNSTGAFNTNNKVFAGRASDGAVLWTFNGSLTSSVDGIVGMPYVDYARNRLYVASRAGTAGTQQSLWVLNTLDGTLVACTACTGLGHLETSPTLSYNGATLYVGSTAGTLYAINAAALTLKWSLALGTAVTGFVWEDFTTVGRLYFAAADGTVRCIQDGGTSGAACAAPWVSPSVPGPLTPLLLGKLFVGSWNGTLGQIYQIRLTDGFIEKQVTVGDGTKQPGDVSTETGNEIFVGTTEGKIFKFSLTLGSL